MGARVPLDLPEISILSCTTSYNKYRHFRVEWVETTLCRRPLNDRDSAPNYRPICPECRSTLRYLNRRRPEGRVDTLAALNR
jgi:hypothetical protein